MIQPGATFKENLQQLPPIDGVQRIDLLDGNGDVVESNHCDQCNERSLLFGLVLSRETVDV